MVEFASFFYGGNFVPVFLVGVLPIVAGILASVLVWKAKVGRVGIQRSLTRDSTTGRPLWKIVARSSGRPVSNCRIQVAGKNLRWDGIDTMDLDIGDDGMGIAAIPFQVDPDTNIVIKSGWLPILRTKFGRLEEVCTSE